MKTKDLLSIMPVALVTASLTIAASWSGRLGADNPAQAPAAQTAKPALQLDGIAVSARLADGTTPAAGQRPALELVATNPTSAPVTTSIQVSVSGSSPADMMSRVPRMPQAMWVGTQPVTLLAGETKTFPLDVNAMLPQGHIIEVVLRPAKDGSAPAAVLPFARNGVLALSFSTQAPTTQTASIR